MQHRNSVKLSVCELSVKRRSQQIFPTIGHIVRVKALWINSASLGTPVRSHERRIIRLRQLPTILLIGCIRFVFNSAFIYFSYDSPRGRGYLESGHYRAPSFPGLCWAPRRLQRGHKKLQISSYPTDLQIYTIHGDKHDSR